MTYYDDDISPVKFTCPGGQKPRPLKTSWNMDDRRHAAPPVKPVTVFYLDTTAGITVGKCSTLKAAYAMQQDQKKQGVRLIVRPYTINEESLAEDREKRKLDSQYGWKEKR